ncbi:exopolysaccharide production repressor protein [Sinorhizobium meliloti]|uniref:exopolysaccharide production repressor protein n=1 Tax=Rhizobium meliloti TaxID=382 RepID=UPI000FDA790F|nr:exopolysaccharide production repressor protein [Sinorhizobium meliloti]RVJ42414.1 protein syrA [Sinorhizobium meliloti]
MSFRIFCLLLWLLLCASSLAIYFALQPSPGLIATTLACLLLFQLAYFGSVLLLVGLAAIAQLSQRLRIFGTYSKTRNHSSK